MPDNVQRLPRTLYALLFAVTLMTAVGNLGLVSVMPAIGRALAVIIASRERPEIPGDASVPRPDAGTQVRGERLVQRRAAELERRC